MVYIVQGVKSVKITIVALVVVVFMVALLLVIAYCTRYSDMESVWAAGSIHDTLTAVELSATAVRLTGGPRVGDGDGDGDDIMADCDDMSTVDVKGSTDDTDDELADDEIETVVIISCDAIIELDTDGDGVDVSNEDTLVLWAAKPVERDQLNI